MFRELKWIAVDFDGTIADTSIDNNFRLESVSPVKGAVEGLYELAKMGWKIIVYTSRPWSEYNEIEKWLEENNVPYRRIICGKLMARYYVDDRNLGASIEEAVKKIGER